MGNQMLPIPTTQSCLRVGDRDFTSTEFSDAERNKQKLKTGIESQITRCTFRHGLHSTTVQCRCSLGASASLALPYTSRRFPALPLCLPAQWPFIALRIFAAAKLSSFDSQVRPYRRPMCSNRTLCTNQSFKTTNHCTKGN